MKNERQKDIDHLKLMIDFHRHVTLLSFAGLVLTANLARRIFDSPQYEYLAFASILFLFISVIASLLSQLNHIDRARKEKIYEFPLQNKFALSIAISILGLIFGLISLATFVVLNWW